MTEGLGPGLGKNMANPSYCVPLRSYTTPKGCSMVLASSMMMVCCCCCCCCCYCCCRPRKALTGPAWYGACARGGGRIERRLKDDQRKMELSGYAERAESKGESSEGSRQSLFPMHPLARWFLSPLLTSGASWRCSGSCCRCGTGSSGCTQVAHRMQP